MSMKLCGVIAVLMVFGMCGYCAAQDVKEVTITGNVLCNRATIPVVWDQSSQDKDHYPVIYAFSGTDEITAQLNEIMDKYYPDKGLDVETAQKFLDEFTKRLRYNIEAGELADKMHKDSEWGSQILAVTGVVYEQDGRRWIKPSSFADGVINYPAKMIAPDKPFVMPENAPIELAVNDTLAIKCVPIPAGSFLQGSPFYQQRYQDEFPHEVVLTKPYYMSETPVTQEVFEAVMGKNPGPTKGPQCPVEKIPYADITEFCRRLSEKNGMTVRPPTDPEVEYAARVGTSNPCFTEKYKEQISEAGVKGSTTPVKSMKPNAWGLFDMLCGGWTVTSTYKVDNARAKEVDPQGPARGEGSIQTNEIGPMHKSRGGYHYAFIRPNMHGAVSEDGGLWEGGTTIFRIVVEGK